MLFPVRIEDRIQAERMVAEQCGFQHRIDGLTNGHRHTIKGRIEQQEAQPGLVLLDHEEQRTFDGQLSFFPPLPCAPLHQNRETYPHSGHAFSRFSTSAFFRTFMG